jgi:hypothetical protein
MRLLQLERDGDFCLTKDYVQDIPQYAILSHTWGPDTEEVTFKDLTDGTGHSRAGYDKIRSCGEQAKRDGLQFFWVDTCCIDKTSSAELSEAINSMHQWYKNAKICYVYLSDFSGSTDISLMRESRWFTRAWTLQELLAPRKLQFFDQAWNPLVMNNSLRSVVSGATGIEMKFLFEDPSRHFLNTSIAKRMSWAAKRQATRQEDRAYSLLGIFRVNMTLLYGEGGEKAFLRLQEEIMKYSSDQSIFAWQRVSDRDVAIDLYQVNNPLPILAQSPADFANSANIIPYTSIDPTPPYEMTNCGLQITLPVLHWPIEEAECSPGPLHYSTMPNMSQRPDKLLKQPKVWPYVSLSCRSETNPSQIAILPVCQLRKLHILQRGLATQAELSNLSELERDSTRKLIFVPYDEISNETSAIRKTVTISNDGLLHYELRRSRFSYMLRTSPTSPTRIRASPPGNWNPEDKTFQPDYRSMSLKLQWDEFPPFFVNVGSDSAVFQTPDNDNADKSRESVEDGNFWVSIKERKFEGFLKFPRNRSTDATTINTLTTGIKVTTTRSVEVILGRHMNIIHVAVDMPNRQ